MRGAGTLPSPEDPDVRRAESPRPRRSALRAMVRTAPAEDDRASSCDVCGRTLTVDDVDFLCLRCQPPASAKERGEIEEAAARIRESRGRPTLRPRATVCPGSATAAGAASGTDEVRLICHDCSGATATTRELQERRLGPMEVRRRTGRHRCVDLCGRLRDGQSPVYECGKVHRRELARRRQIAHRRGRCRTCCMTPGGTERDAVTHFLERARARGRGTGGVAGGWSA